VAARRGVVVMMGWWSTNSTLTTEEVAVPGVGRRGGRDTADHSGGLQARGAPAGLFSDRVRPLRFLLVGGLCGAVQLGLFAVFLGGGVQTLPANVLAFLLSAQLNFALSRWFTWGDRRTLGLVRRWLAFHGSIAGTALLNQCMFVVAQVATPDLVASALGIGAAAVVNFLVQDRLVFRGRHPRHDSPAGY
jgi:putative flippase GtrA